MPSVVLTEAIIREANPPTILWDIEVSGLGCRLHPTGRKVFVLQYRLPDGQQRRMGLGPVGLPFNVDTARHHARGLLLQVMQGVDVAEARKGAYTPKRASGRTIEVAWAEFVARYLEAKKLSASYVTVSKIQFRKYVLPHWEGKDIRHITRRDVIALLDGIMDEGKGITANRVLGIVRKLFNWCIQRTYLDANPAHLVDKPAPEDPRERILDDRELALLWRASGELRYPWGPFYRLLMLMPNRRTEIGEMRWQDVNLAAATWTLSASQTKNKSAHVVPLSDQAVDVLASVPREGEWVFTTTGRGPITNYYDGKRRFDAQVARVSDGELISFVNHDLRRTCATFLGDNDIAPHVIEGVLNHKPQGVTRRVYNRSQYLPARREALALWAQHLLGLVERYHPVPTPAVRRSRKR